jgi:hypothetical protein
MWRLSSLVLLFLISCVGCSKKSDSVGGDSPRQKATNPSATIGTLKYRRQTVHILADGRYTVKDHRDKTLATGLNEWELAEQYPFLYEQVIQGLADRSLLLADTPRPTNRVGSEPPTPKFETRRIEGTEHPD